MLNRVEHHRNASQSSYSSIESDWQTIRSEDEHMRSESIISKDAQVEVRESNSKNISSPFVVNEEDSGDEASKNEINASIKNGMSNGINNGLHDYVEEESDSM